jgi:hypothetical protein
MPTRLVVQFLRCGLSSIKVSPRLTLLLFAYPAKELCRASLAVPEAA